MLAASTQFSKFRRERVKGSLLFAGESKPEDLAMLRFSRAAMARRPTFQPEDQFILEITDVEITHSGEEMRAMSPLLSFRDQRVKGRSIQAAK